MKDNRCLMTIDIARGVTFKSMKGMHLGSLIGQFIRTFHFCLYLGKRQPVA